MVTMIMESIWSFWLKEDHETIIILWKMKDERQQQQEKQEEKQDFEKFSYFNNKNHHQMNQMKSNLE